MGNLPTLPSVRYQSFIIGLVQISWKQIGCNYIDPDSEAQKFVIGSVLKHNGLQASDK